MKKPNQKDHRRGFTIIELIVVIVVIGILATLTTIGISQYASRGEDAQRTSGAIAITESLEKYYNENGEYPSCNTLTGDVSALTGSNGILPGLQASALRAPNAPESETNSIRCSDLSYGSTEDYYAYVPIGDCAENPCAEFIFKYIESSTSDVKAIHSRHKTAAADVGAPSLTFVSKSFTRLSVSWNSLSATNYRVQIDTSGAFNSSNLQSFDVTGTSRQFTGLTPGQQYYVRVAPILYGGIVGYWSNAISQTTWIYTISGVTATPNSTTQVTVNWNAITVPSTPQSYSVRYSTSSSMTGATTVNNFTSNSAIITGLTVGATYYFQVRATTSTPESYTSPWYPTSNPPSATTTPPAPSTCTMTKTSNTRVTATWSAVSGAASYTTQLSTSSSFASGNTETTGITGTSKYYDVNNDTTYYMRVKSVASGGSVSSGWKTCGSITTGIDAPATPSSCSLAKTNNTRVTATWSAVSGAASYTTQLSTSSSFASGNTETTGITTTSKYHNVNNGTTYYMRVKAVATGGSVSSGWRTCGSATTGVDAPTGYGWQEQPYGVRNTGSINWMPGQYPGGGNYWTHGTRIYTNCSAGATRMVRLYAWYAYSGGGSPNSAALLDWTASGDGTWFMVGGNDSWYVWWQGWVGCQVGGTRSEVYLGQYRES